MIHYHGTPCGGPRQDVARFLAGRHALIPWPRQEDLGVSAGVCQSFCLDNGAYSAWVSGHPITEWGAYYEFCVHWSRHPAFDFAIIPDIIDGIESDNDKLVSQWNATVSRWQIGAPVWHMHESLDRLDRLVSHWPRVCLGSSGQWASVGTDSWWRRMSEAMDVACDSAGRPRCKLHGLRMLDPEVFSRLPLSSADSTNAVRNSASVSRYGMYAPPTAAQRMATIADRTEAHQSAATWRRLSQLELLFSLGAMPTAETPHDDPSVK